VKQDRSVGLLGWTARRGREDGLKKGHVLKDTPSTPSRSEARASLNSSKPLEGLEKEKKNYINK